MRCWKINGSGEDEKSTSSDLLFIDTFREGWQALSVPHIAMERAGEDSRCKITADFATTCGKSLMNFEKIKMEHVEHGRKKGFRENFVSLKVYVEAAEDKKARKLFSFVIQY